MKFVQYLSLTTLIVVCFIACKRSTPSDQYFCKAEEVYVLEEPFQEETAIIVMYKGDDVFLLGDTVYLELPSLEHQDSVVVDSTLYYVKVKAKRGVIGWVNALELQHDRPKAVVIKPAAPVKIPPKLEAKPDPLAILDSLLTTSDSSKQELLGTYAYTSDSLNQHQFNVLAVDSSRWSFQWKMSGNCDSLLSGEAVLKGRTLAWQAADSCQYRFQWLSEQQLQISVDSSCLNRMCVPKGKLSKLKIQKERTLEQVKPDSSSQSDGPK